MIHIIKGYSCNITIYHGLQLYNESKNETAAMYFMMPKETICTLELLESGLLGEGILPALCDVF